MAGPAIAVVVSADVAPSGMVFDAVVVAAQGCEVLFVGLAAFGVTRGVVEVAVGGGHAASGEDTGVVSGFDCAA